MENYSNNCELQIHLAAEKPYTAGHCPNGPGFTCLQIFENEVLLISPTQPKLFFECEAMAHSDLRRCFELGYLM